MKRVKSSSPTVLITLISPVLGIVQSISYMAWSQRKWILILFVTIYGSLMPLIEGNDSYSFQQDVEYHYVGLSIDAFFRELWSILLFNPMPGTKGDVYIHVISYLTGGLLNLPKLFFTVVAFVFGYFYISSLSIILKWDNRAKKPLVLISLVLLFIIYRGVDTLQSVRTWTGMWILFYGLVSYLNTRQFKYILLIIASPLVHFIYFAMVVPALLAIILRNVNSKFFIIVYALSFIVQIGVTGVIRQVERTELGQSKIKSYYREDTSDLEEKNAEIVTHWYVEYGKARTLWWGSNLMAMVIILGGFYKRRMTHTEAGIFTTGLLMASLANFGDFIPAFYSRVMVNAGLYFIATALLLLIRKEFFKGSVFRAKFMKALLWLSLLVFIPKFIYTLSNLLYFTSVYNLAFPFVGWFSGQTFSLRDIVDWLI